MSKYVGQLIRKGYGNVQFFHFNGPCNSLMVIETIKVNDKFSRYEKYKAICKMLRQHKIVCPCYKPTQKEMAKHKDGEWE